MSLTRADIRGVMYLRIEGLGGKRVAQTVQADRIVDPVPFQRSQASNGDFNGAIIYRPNVDQDVDGIREAGLVNGSALLQTGAAYADTVDLNYELCYLLHPYAINECIRMAPREIWGEVTVPLTLWPDGDLSDEGVTHWSNGPVTPTKSTDPAYKFIGNHRTLIVLTTPGNLYAQSDDIPVTPNDQFAHFAVGQVDMASSGGTAYYALIDTTNPLAERVIYETTFQDLRDQIIRKQTTIPSGCYKVAIRVGATATGVTTNWKAFPSHMIGAGTSPTQSWIKEQMNLLGFGPASYYRSTGTDRYNATDRVWTQWTPENGADYTLLPFVPASDYYSLQINKFGGLRFEDYWFHGLRQMSDIQDEMDNENAVTDIDQEYMFAAVEYLITSQLGESYDAQFKRAKAKLDAHRIARPVSQPKREQGVHMVTLRNQGRRIW